AVRAVQLIKRPIKRGGLSRTGRAGHQENPIWPFDDFLKLLVILFLKTEVLNADAHAVGAENTKHNRLPVIRRQSAYTKIDRRLVHLKLNTTVLRQALFGDIDAGHDFQARDERSAHAQRDAIALDAFAVD